MCGIGGILRIHPAGKAPPSEVSIPEAWLDIIDEAVKHRGPDGTGRFRDRAVRADGSVVDVAFVHRRLSIIDHRDGWQPMVQGGTALLKREDGPYLETACHVCPRCAELASRSAAHGGVGASPRLTGVTGDAEPRLAPGPPMTDASSAANAALLAVVFNGCIYNHRDLRKELQAAGHVFATDHSDTEVLLHGWREWGEQMVARCDGMLAAAIWDRAAALIAVARDRAGEKPLHYVRIDRAPPNSAGALVFASVPGVVARLGDRIVGDAGSDLDADKIAAWISLGFWRDPPSCSIFAAQPAEVIAPRSWSEGCFAPERYWSPPARRKHATLDATRVEKLLDDAVGSRLESDVPLGCFLSGGVDSSLIAAVASRHLPSLSTFSVRMPDPRYDESETAARIASALGTRHTTLDCNPDPSGDLVTLIRQLGLPLGDSSILPTYWVCRAARGHVKVVLSGDGGDELFCGYARYVAAGVIRHLRPLLAALPGGLLSARDPKSARAKLLRLKNAAARGGYADLLRIFPSELADLLELRVHGRSPEPLRLRTDRFSAAVANPDQDAPRWDFDNYLPQDLLTKVDTASMAEALEVRAPFLSRDMIDACLAEPLSSLMPHGRRKGLLRAVARKHFPSEIVDRPKQGFAIPIGEWFRSDYGGMKQLLMDHLESAEPWGSPSLGIDLNMTFVRRMLDEHMNGKRDHSQRLYMLLVLSIWAKGLAA